MSPNLPAAVNNVYIAVIQGVPDKVIFCPLGCPRMLLRESILVEGPSRLIVE